jgi:hypothetical protein
MRLRLMPILIKENRIALGLRSKYGKAAEICVSAGPSSPEFVSWTFPLCSRFFLPLVSRF